jgi:omega-amidase
MKIASVQLDIKWHDRYENLVKASHLIERAAQNSCELIIFPEMFNSGYSMSSETVCESMDGDTLSTLSDLAKSHNINIIAGLAVIRRAKEIQALERQAEQEDSDEGQAASSQLAVNIAVLINNQGELVSDYVKNYPFTLAGEKQVYATGQQQTTYQLNGYTGSTFICYDLRFPELFRQVAKHVDFMVVIASWPSTRQNHWELLLQARAIENQCFVIGVNRIGKDGNQLSYTGGSLVCDPMGKVLSLGSASQEYIETTIELADTKRTREQFPFLDDMKID